MLDGVLDGKNPLVRHPPVRLDPGVVLKGLHHGAVNTIVSVELVKEGVERNEANDIQQASHTICCQDVGDVATHNCQKHVDNCIRECR